MIKVTVGVRGRVLAIALVPSAVILGLGAGIGGYFVAVGIHDKNWATAIDSSVPSGTGIATAEGQERRLSMLRIAGDRRISGDLATARHQLDAALVSVETRPEPMRAMDPAAAAAVEAASAPLFMRLSTVRQQIDTDAISAADAYQFYNEITALSLGGMSLIARTSPGTAASVEESRARGVFTAMEAFSRAAALSAFAVVRGATPQPQLDEFNHEVGYYRTEITQLVDDLQGPVRARLQTLLDSPAWQRMSALETAVDALGTSEGTDDAPATDLGGWLTDAVQVDDGLRAVYNAQQLHALDVATDASNRTLRTTILAATAAAAAALAAMAAALWMSSRLTRRLHRLRGETLDLANQQLPRIMDRLQRGEPVDVDTELRTLEYGSDEIGEVGDAFNRAQLAAVSAAVTEARTREGVKSVFLNIARRSQVVMHRLLEVLDKAEYTTRDPEQLQVLFQLDHLATRERRNAENLVILGGERPGRQWRTAVTLSEIVRGAVAETEDYAKVHVIALPDVSIKGGVVADLVHLLAELLDNATSFSPPESRVDITGNIVGRGVAVNISDQGIGMSRGEIDRINDTLKNAPSFSIDTLSSDSRLGLFVVARLAEQNGVRVRLTESDYGGIRAIVIIPTDVMVSEHDDTLDPPQPAPSQTAPGLSAVNPSLDNRRNIN